MPRASLSGSIRVASDPEHPRWAIQRTVWAADIPAPAKLIMCLLLDRAGMHAPEVGEWSPGTRLLAKMTGLDVHTVSKYLALLDAHGWLSRATQRGRRTRYVLSAGRSFPGDVKNPITTDVDMPITADAKNHITVRPSPELEKELDQERAKTGENSPLKTVYGPASTSQATQEVMCKSTSLRNPIDTEALLVGLDL